MLVALMLTVAVAASSVPSLQGRNSIEGQVTTPERKGLDNVRVFLLTDSYGQRAQTYTDGSGRYQFRDVGSGNYYIQVEPGGIGYERQTQRIEVNPYAPAGLSAGEIFRLDIVLKPEKDTTFRPGDDLSANGSGVVFMQAIPPTAKEAYELATQSLKTQDLKTAEVQLTNAIKIFPDYFDALELLGTEYVKHAFYDSAEPLLSHAVEVNKSGWHSYYGLGVSLMELGRRAEGLTALRRAVDLNPRSVNASMRLGMELAKDDQTTDEALKVVGNVAQMAGKQLPDAYLTLASLHSKKKEYRAAADALEGYLHAASPSAQQREDIKRKIRELREKKSPH
jgi:tetratricopeptide (TPR) repeat protein